MDFKEKYTFEQRSVESSRILEKYPTRIPVICQRNTSDKLLPNIDKSKYLVPNDLTVGQFTYIIRKRIKIQPEKALFVFVNHNILAPVSLTMKELYMNNVNDDGFIYMYYSGENTFG